MDSHPPNCTRKLRPRINLKNNKTILDKNRGEKRLSLFSCHEKNPEEQEKTSSIKNIRMKALVTPNVDSMPDSSTGISARSSHQRSPTCKHAITPQEHDASIVLASMSKVDSDSEKHSGIMVASTRNDNQYESFPVIIHKFVTEAAESNPTVIQWVADGKAFKINEKHKKLGSILKKYFKHGKYSSVQRQLNMYGWSKHLSGSYKGAFYHPKFHKTSALEQLRSIKRKGPPSASRSSRKASKVIARRSSRKIPNALTERISIENSVSDDECKPTSDGNKNRSSKARKKLAFKRIQTKPTKQSKQNISSLAKKQLRKINTKKSKTAVSSLSPCGRSEQLQEKSKCKISNNIGSRELLEKLTPPSTKGTSMPLCATSLTMEQLYASPADWSPFLPGILRQESIQIVNSTCSCTNENRSPFAQHEISHEYIRSSSDMKCVQNTRNEMNSNSTDHKDNVKTPMTMHKPNLVQPSIDRTSHLESQGVPKSVASLKEIYKNIIEDRTNINEGNQVESVTSYIQQALQDFTGPNHNNSQSVISGGGMNAGLAKKEGIVEDGHLGENKSIISYPSPKLQDTTGCNSSFTHEIGINSDVAVKSIGRDSSNSSSDLSKHYSSDVLVLDDTDKAPLKRLQTSNIKNGQVSIDALSSKRLCQLINDHNYIGFSDQNGGTCLEKSHEKSLGCNSTTTTASKCKPGVKGLDLTTIRPASSNYRSPISQNSILTSYSPKPLPSNASKNVSIPRGNPPEPPALPLSREASSSFAPLPLTQRVSSSFYLPFVGMSDTLSDALACSNAGMKQKVAKSLTK